MQYADDTLILIKNSEEDIKNLKFMLMCFEDMLGLKINFHKSEVIVMGLSDDKQIKTANILNCKRGLSPSCISAFLFQTTNSPLSNACSWPVRKLGDKIEPWLCKLLSSGGRLTLSNDCLDNLTDFSDGPLFATRWDSCQSRFYWEGSRPKRKYHLVLAHDLKT
jgi:hypothetical protein